MEAGTRRLGGRLGAAPDCRRTLMATQVRAEEDAWVQVSAAAWQIRAYLGCTHRLVVHFGSGDLTSIHLPALMARPRHHFLTTPRSQ